MTRAKTLGPLVVGDARFTPITPTLLRLEQAPGGRFTDLRSTFALDRSAAAPYEAHRAPGRVEIDTGRLRLVYEEDGRPFHTGNLVIELHGPPPLGAAAPVVWRPGLAQRRNLGGPLATLDGVVGPTPLPHGLLSRDGWFLLDDAQRPLLEETGPAPGRAAPRDDGWWRARSVPDATDAYFFGYGLDLRAPLRDLAALAGPVPLPRAYALGSWYSRYWPYTSAEYREIVLEYARHGYPLDVLVFDMDWHREGWTGWSWNRALLPDAEALLAWLHARGLAVTLNLHPADGVGPHEDAYPAYMRALGRDPGRREVVPFDPWDERAMTALFEEVHEPLARAGVDFWWLDWQQVIEHLDPVRAGNLLFWMNRAYFAFTRRHGRRGLSFSRWGGFGDHRHPVHFSGDSHTGWPMLAFAVPFTVASGNAGLFFWSHDIGGHIGPRDEEVYTRWVQFGALSAGLRLHSTRAAEADRRPWAHAAASQRSTKRAFALRAALFPYIYSSAAQSCQQTVPLLRALYLDRPDDERAYACAQQYRLGDALLVAPVVASGVGGGRLAEQAVYFPADGSYFHLLTGERFEGGAVRLVASDLDELPVFVRGGAALPLAPLGARVAGPPSEELTVRVFPGEDGVATRQTLYEDDGASDQHLAGACAETPLVYERQGDRVRLVIGPVTGTFAGQPKRRGYVVELAGTRAATRLVIDGVQTNSRYDAEAEINTVHVPPGPLDRAIVIEGEVQASDGVATRRRVAARRAKAAAGGEPRSPQEEARADWLVRGVAIVPVLGGADGTGPRDVYLFDEDGRIEGGRVEVRFEDRWSGPRAERHVRRVSAGAVAPGRPLQLAEAGLPALHDTAPAFDKARLVVASFVVEGQRHELERTIADEIALPLQLWQRDAADGSAFATGFYSAHEQPVTIVASAEATIELWLGDERALATAAPVSPEAPLVVTAIARQGHGRLRVRLGRGDARFEVRVRARLVFVERPPERAPAVG